MKNMGQMMKQMKEMQQKMGQVQQELATKELVGTAGGGAVEITLNGHKEMLSVKIGSDVLADVEMLQDLIVVAYNNASQKVADLVERDLGQLTSGINIPGLM